MVIMYGVINLDTGEIVANNVERTITKGKVSRAIVDDMIRRANCIEDIDEELLNKWLFVIGEINKTNKDQYRLYGEMVDEELIFETATKNNMLVYVAKIVRLSHKWSNRLMVSERTGISSWKQLWEVLGCTSRATQAKARKFLLDNGLIRTISINRKGIEETEFYLNPFLYRSRHFVNSIAIKVFKDFAKEAVNINTYTYRYLQKIDVL